jgi:hypothetical protein
MLSGLESNTTVTITAASIRTAPMIPPGLRFMFFIMVAVVLGLIVWAAR